MSQKTAATTKRLILCHGDKGGVGKSTFARLLAEWLTDASANWQGFDTDSTNGHLFRFYAERTQPIVLREDGSIDQILNAVEGDATVLLVDLGARTGELIQDWCLETDLLTLKDEIGLAITVCYILDPVKDSTSLLKDVVETFGSAADYVLVKNHANGSKFPIYDESKTRKHLMKELGAIEITMPELLADTFQVVDAKNLSWAAATKESSLQLAGRQRVKGFLRSGFAELQKVREYLMV